MTSKKKAMSNAKAQMASDIQTTMKVVSDNYVKSSEFNNKEEVLERFEENARTVVNQELRGVRTICEKLVKTQEGKYKTYLALELSGEELLNKYSEILGNDENLKIENIILMNNKGLLKNKTFMLTGKLNGVSRAEAKSLIEKNSGKIINNVNKKLDYLIAGEKPTTKKINIAAVMRFFLFVFLLNIIMTK